MTELTAPILASAELRGPGDFPNEHADGTSGCEPRRWLHSAYRLIETRRSTAPGEHCNTPLPF